jgi:hypothetical protein
MPLVIGPRSSYEPLTSASLVSSLLPRSSKQPCVRILRAALALSLHVSLLFVASVVGCTRTDEVPPRSADTGVGTRVADTVVSATKWYFGLSDETRPKARFVGASKGYSSGRMILVLDTSTARDGDASISAARADSVALDGVSPSERIAYICRIAGVDQNGYRVGLVTDSAPKDWRRPRLAWVFDSVPVRIRQISTDSIVCAITPEGY